MVETKLRGSTLDPNRVEGTTSSLPTLHFGTAGENNANRAARAPRVPVADARAAAVETTDADQPARQRQRIAPVIHSLE